MIIIQSINLKHIIRKYVKKWILWYNKSNNIVDCKKLKGEI